ncbi:MAG: glycyl-radical enzyme activating protein, partial [Clostridiales Family XIII bacterium]|nr:glycyl-radical enzyme activating protein [Clostridiales Family XIII bacterium]
MSEIVGTVFNVQRYSIDDGPGIRTTVFVKGCPLRCPWCSNPESQNPHPELLYRYTACTHCGTCVKTCSDIENAVSMDDAGAIHIDREKCTVCGACVETCPSKALSITGEEKTTDEVMKTVLRDEVYYEDGGGVTCSGGEILAQPEFVEEIFRRCKERGIHTNADTSGYGNSEAFRKILDVSDLCYFDVKVLDPERHKEIIGVPNDLIMANMKVLADSGVQTVLRYPVVPGMTDDDANIDAIADTVKKLGRQDDWVVNILPYHRYGENKYASVGMVYPIPDVPDNTAENL